MSHLLHVCLTCRPLDWNGEGERPGALLYQAVAENPPEGFELRPIECLSGCKRACTMAFSAPRKASLLFGDLSLDCLTDLDAMADLYRASSDGLVPWKERPASFRPGLIARIPTL